MGGTRVVTERTAKALQCTVLGKVLPRAGRVRGNTNAIGHLLKRIVRQIRGVVKLPRPAFFMEYMWRGLLSNVGINQRCTAQATAHQNVCHQRIPAFVSIALRCIRIRVYYTDM